MPGRNRLNETAADIKAEIRYLAVEPPKSQRLSAPRVREKLIEKWPQRAGEIGEVDRVRRLINDLKGRGEEEDQQLLESPFQWEYMETYIPYGLSWESSAFLLEMWRFMRSGLWLTGGGPSPTVRQMRWFWRVHLASPGLKNSWSIFHLGQRFVQREQRKDLLGESVGMDDLTAFVTLTPWVSLVYERVYNLAVLEQGIPPLQRETQSTLDGLEVGILVLDGWIDRSPAEQLITAIRAHEGIDENQEKANNGDS